MDVKRISFCSVCVVLLFLGLASTVLVTEDSVSMVSEAVNAGKQVLVMRLGNGKLPAKHKRFHRMLADRSMVGLADSSDFSEKIIRLRCVDSAGAAARAWAELDARLQKLL